MFGLCQEMVVFRIGRRRTFRMLKRAPATDNIKFKFNASPTPMKDINVSNFKQNIRTTNLGTKSRYAKALKKKLDNGRTGKSGGSLLSFTTGLAASAGVTGVIGAYVAAYVGMKGVIAYIACTVKMCQDSPNPCDDTFAKLANKLPGVVLRMLQSPLDPLSIASAYDAATTYIVFESVNGEPAEYSESQDLSRQIFNDDTIVDRAGDKTTYHLARGVAIDPNTTYRVTDENNDFEYVQAARDTDLPEFQLGDCFQNHDTCADCASAAMLMAFLQGWVGVVVAVLILYQLPNIFSGVKLLNEFFKFLRIQVIAKLLLCYVALSMLIQLVYDTIGLTDATENRVLYKVLIASSLILVIWSLIHFTSDTVTDTPQQVVVPSG